MANNIPLTYVIDIQAPGSQNITKQLKKSLSSADQSADALSTSIRNVGESAENTGKDLSQSSRQLQKYSATQRQASRSTQTLSTNSRGATNTLTNFNRVVQDAPFGIIGIANNIDPLVDSFQRLKTSTGSAGSAFKALLGSLAGPQGVLFAVSAVTSALVAFGPAISEFLTGNTKEAKESTDEFLDSLLSLNKEVAGLRGLSKFETIKEDLVLVNDQLNPLIKKQERLAELEKIERTLGGQTPLDISRERLRLAGELEGKGVIINQLTERRTELVEKLAKRQRLENSEEFQRLQREKERLELLKERQAAEKKLRDQFGGQLRPDFAVQIPDDKIIKDEVDLSLGIIEKQLDQPLDKSLLTPFLPPESTFQNLENSFRDSFFKIEQIGGQTYKRLREFADLSAQQQVQTFQDGALAVTTSLTAVFGETKALRTAEAVINGSAAIINTFASVPFPANIAAAALIAAKTAKQIANINSTEIGSSAKKPSTGSGGGPTQGFTTGNRSTGGAQSVPNVNRRQERQPININVENRLDQRGLSIAAKRGEQQTNQEATIINSDA